MIKILIIAFIILLVLALGAVAFFLKRNQSDDSDFVENQAPNLHINPNSTSPSQQQVHVGNQAEQLTPQRQTPQQPMGQQPIGQLHNKTPLQEVLQSTTTSTNSQAAAQSFNQREGTQPQVTENLDFNSGFQNADSGLHFNPEAHEPQLEIPTTAPAVETMVQTPVVEQANELNLDNDTFDFNLDEPTTAPAVETMVQTPVVEQANELNLDTFDFNLDEPTIETPAPVVEQANELNLDTFDFNLDEPTTAPAVEASSPNSNNPITNDSLDLDITQSTITEDTSSIGLSDDFEILNELDNNQVTLNLATQYLDLGEYDSAKRLLQEVIDNGTAEQIQEARNILVQAG